jgi:hypothetical protein
MHNAGKGPLTLSFGMQYARMAVDAIRLSLTDARGKVTTLTVRHYITTDPNFRDEHGSLGTVTLQPGESYSFPIDLRYYKDELGLPIATDHYTLQATFTEPVRNDKSVVLPEPRMPLWTGSVTAPPLPVTVTEDSIQ